MTETTRRAPIMSLAFVVLLAVAAGAADAPAGADAPAPDRGTAATEPERERAAPQEPANKGLTLESEGTIDPEASQAEYNPVDPEQWEELQRLAAFMQGLGAHSHRLGGSFTTVPAPGWRADVYEGYFRNSFRVGRGIRLGAGVSYGQTNEFKDDNFPNSLYRATASLSVSGPRFNVTASATNRADEFLKRFDDVNLTLLAMGTVYRKGPHGLVIGGVYTSRNELWNLALPMPLIAYRYVSRNLIVNVGVPFFLLWRPSQNTMMVLAGMLPGVGSFQFTYRAGKHVTIGCEYTHTKEHYYLHRYPYHDWRFLDHELRRLTGNLNKKSQFYLDGHTTGGRITVRPHESVSFFVFAGVRLAQSYNYTTNVLSQGPRPTRIPASFIAKGGLECRFWSGKGEARSRE